MKKSVSIPMSSIDELIKNLENVLATKQNVLSDKDAEILKDVKNVLLEFKVENKKGKGLISKLLIAEAVRQLFEFFFERRCD